MFCSHADLYVLIWDHVVSCAVMRRMHVLTAEIGNYCEEYVEQEYLTGMKLLPNQTRVIEMQIMHHHREHVYVAMFS